MKRSILSAVVAAALSVTGGAALAAGGDKYVEYFPFSFDGPFGKYDQNQLQRGLKVYTEVCAACHGLRQVYFRNLSDEGGVGFSEEEVKAYAAEFFEVYDAELDEDRPAKPADKFPAVDAVGAPDLSLMAKARAGFSGPNGLGINQMLYGMGGADYIASLLTHYTGKEEEQYGAILYKNESFDGGWISMAPPLADGQVDYEDGTPNDVRHMSEDVAAFLMWAAEPKMSVRKQMGMTSFIFLALLFVLLYLTNKKLWAPIKRKDYA